MTRCSKPLKQIVTATRNYWDHPGTRPAVRRAFDQLLKCGTRALGAEVFASDNERKIVPHTCKVRPCPSCGHRATLTWQREQWCALPDIRYVSIVFTMPDLLWPIFRENRHLLHDLPKLGAAVIQNWAKRQCGARVSVMAIPHTFGAKLNFNTHVHMLVSASGFREADCAWIEIPFPKDKLMHLWRHAVISYLWAAVQAGILRTDVSPHELKTVFGQQYLRWWNIHVDAFASKTHFLRYVGRYLRRPPIAQHRIVEVTNQNVRFWYKDKRSKQRLYLDYTLEEFATCLADQVPDYYEHGVRYFGLLAPCSRARTSTAVFLTLGQRKRPRPKRLTWAFCLKRAFGVDPLLDTRGGRMNWIGRLRPALPN